MRNAIVFAALALALATHVAVPATALAKDGDHAAHQADASKFPMPAADFKQKIDARMAKARERMEKHVTKLPAEKAKEVRAHFDAGLAKVNDEVAKATADGTVTKDEAQKVREAARALRHKGGKHARKAAK